MEGRDPTESGTIGLSRWLAEAKIGFQEMWVYFSIIQFFQINFLWMAALYGHFTWLPFWAYVLAGMMGLATLGLTIAILNRRFVMRHQYRVYGELMGVGNGK